MLLIALEMDHDMDNVDYRAKPLFDTNLVKLDSSVSLFVLCVYLMFAM